MRRLNVLALVAILAIPLFLTQCRVALPGEDKPPPGSRSVAVDSHEQRPEPAGGAAKPPAQSPVRRRVRDRGMAAIAIEEVVPLAAFRLHATVGRVGLPMADGRVEVTVQKVDRKPYSNPMARGPVASHEYDVTFTVVNRGLSKAVIDVVEGVLYSDVPDPIIRTVAMGFDKDHNVMQDPVELGPGEFEEFHIPSMGREGTLKSVGIALSYRDKTESRFWVPVPPDVIRNVPDPY